MYLMQIKKKLTTLLILMLAVANVGITAAHGVSSGDAHTIAEQNGVLIKLVDFFVLGAKHMMVGYDHLLFILGIVFLLTTFKSVVKYISYFTIGHSITLILATLMDISFNYHIIDAIIGLSILYKGYDNLFDIRKKFKISTDTRWIIFGFGLIHGFGLSTRLQMLELPENNLLAYILSFNIGVEVGQIMVLGLFVWLLGYARDHKYFTTFKIKANQFLMGAGIFLFAIGMIKAITG
jgi:hypothetical protein